MKWIKASDALPSKDGYYHCLIKYFHTPANELTKVAVEFKSPFWTLYEQNYVVQWLDETDESLPSPSGATSVEGNEAVAAMDKAIKCLYLELPSVIADDVKSKWNAVKASHPSTGAEGMAVEFELWQIEKNIYRIKDTDMYESEDKSIIAASPVQLFQLFINSKNK